MITPNETHNILIANPNWDEGASREWLRCAATLAKTFTMLRLYDPEFAMRVCEWHELSSDLDLESFTLVDEFSRKRGPAVIPTHTMLAEIFSILEGCGLFRYVAPYYQFTIPDVVLPDTMRKAVYRLLDTQDADEISHPEKIVNSTQPRQLPRALSVLEKAPSCFIYRAPGVVISELEI